MEQEILNQIAEKEGYADWHELTEQNDPNTIYEYTLKALNQALGQSEQLLALARYMCEHQNNSDGKTAKDYVQDFFSQ